MTIFYILKRKSVNLHYQVTVTVFFRFTIIKFQVVYIKYQTLYADGASFAVFLSFLC